MAGHNNWINVSHTEAKFDFSSLTPMSKRNAIGHTVERVAACGDTLFLALSGGMDSEFVANCLYAHDVPFTPLLIDYGVNAAELWYAYLWCKEHDITPKVLTLSLHDMLTSLPEIALKYQTAYVSSIDFILEKYAEQQGGKLLVGSAEPFRTVGIGKDKLDEALSPILQLYSYDYAVDIAFPGKHPLCFMSYTPEMMHSLVRDFDYTKPVQLAKAEYYGVAPRPKIDAHFKLAINPALNTISVHTHRQLSLYKIELGHRDTFLQTCEAKRILEADVNKT